MSSVGIISKKHLDEVNAQLNDLRSDVRAMASVMVEQQRTIDALTLCVAEELGISPKRAQTYRARGMANRQAVAAQRQQQQQAAEGVDTSQLAAKRAPISAEAPERVPAAFGKKPAGESKAA
jgi:hypothetical protein